jgi:hypothetical protein
MAADHRTGGQLDVGGHGIVLQLSDAAGPRDGHHVGAVDQPGQSDLRRREAVRLGDDPQRVEQLSAAGHVLCLFSYTRL